MSTTSIAAADVAAAFISDTPKTPAREGFWARVFPRMVAAREAQAKSLIAQYGLDADIQAYKHGGQSGTVGL